LRVNRIARTGDAGQPATAAVAAGPAAGQPATGHAPAVAEGACAGVVQPSANPAPMRLFHLSIAYLTLLFAVIAVTSLLPWGSW
jgi:heme O synthase-like polyprenyltransferase